MAPKKQVKKITAIRAVTKKQAKTKSSAKLKSAPKKGVKKTAKTKKRQTKKPEQIRLKGLLQKTGISKQMAVISLAILMGVGILGGGWKGMEWALADNILNGVSFLGEDVSLKSENELEEELRREVAEFFQKVWLVKVGEEEYEMTAADLGVEISVADTMRKLRQFGREGGILKQLKERGEGLLFGKEVELTVAVNEDKLRASLESLPLLLAPKLTDLVEMDKQGNLRKKEEVREFFTADVEKMADEIKTGADLLMAKNLTVEISSFKPEVNEDELRILGEEMNEWAERQLVLLWQVVHKRWEFELDFESDLDWFELKETEKGMEVTLNDDKINGFLNGEVVPDVTQEMQGAKLSLDEEGRIRVEGRAIPGESLDFEAARQLILAALKNEAETVLLPAKITEPEVEIDPEVTEKFGIDSLLGTGWSDFSGSPSNRINNVKVGMEKFDGILVGPGETFSFNENLGYVGSATGFLPELVIKENGTVPEFGGGLCQVSTTHYRAALMAGLPILDRKNHTYHVSHYEPGGSDATIYPPNPDMKFQNDTEGWILIQAWTDENGVDAFVDIYGKDEGRKVELEGPWISKWRKPGPSIVIETTELPKGKREIKEYEVYGFDAEWVRRIWKNGDLENEEVIESHYLPWPEVVLVGIGE